MYILYGLLGLSLKGYIITGFIFTQLTIVSSSLYLHRCQAHRALDLHPFVAHFFRFWLWLTTGMVTKEWVAVHRKHHAKCETVDDPHSPQILGIKKIFWQGAEVYHQATLNPIILEQYGKGTPNDKMEAFYIRYRNIGTRIMLLIDVVLFGIPGITIWAVQMLWVPLCAAGIINGIGHYSGYRNYETADASRNILPLGLLISGEELHNNHHAFGSSAKFSNKWWEFDIGWGYIKLLNWLRLAKVKKVAPKLFCIAGKNIVDIETVKVLITNRLQILAEYDKNVILPILAAKNFNQKYTTLLTLNTCLMKETDKQSLEDLLNKHADLNIIYSYREKLQQLGQHKVASNDELINQLNDWCNLAESSQLVKLRDFSLTLKSYASTQISCNLTEVDYNDR